VSGKGGGGGGGGVGQLEFVFEMYVRSKMTLEEAQRKGVCAFLHAGIQERAMAGFR